MLNGRPLSYRKHAADVPARKERFRETGDVHSSEPGTSQVKPVRNTCGVSSALSCHSSGSAGFEPSPLIPSLPWAFSAPLLFSLENVYAEPGLETPGKSPLEHSFYGMVLALACRHATPLDVLVLWIFSQRLRHIPV